MGVCHRLVCRLLVFIIGYVCLVFVGFGCCFVYCRCVLHLDDDLVVLTNVVVGVVVNAGDCLLVIYAWLLFGCDV